MISVDLVISFYEDIADRMHYSFFERRLLITGAVNPFNKFHDFERIHGISLGFYQLIAENAVVGFFIFHGPRVIFVKINVFFPWTANSQGFIFKLFLAKGYTFIFVASCWGKNAINYNITIFKKYFQWELVFPLSCTGMGHCHFAISCFHQSKGVISQERLKSNKDFQQNF